MLRILSLGAGVQSTTMALMAAHGEIGPMPDCAIFADTQWGKTSHVPIYGWCYIADYPDGGEPDYDLWSPTHWMPLTR